MPVSTGSDTRMYSPRSESNLGYANDAEDNPHGVGDPETMEQLRDKRMAEAENKQTVHDLPHLRIDVPNPEPEMPPVPDMPEEPMMDDDNENARGAEVSQMTGMPDMGNLSIGNATGTMPQPGGMLATGEPMELAWRLLKMPQPRFTEEQRAQRNPDWNLDELSRLLASMGYSLNMDEVQEFANSRQGENMLMNLQTGLKDSDLRRLRRNYVASQSQPIPHHQQRELKIRPRHTGEQGHKMWPQGDVEATQEELDLMHGPMSAEEKEAAEGDPIPDFWIRDPWNKRVGGSEAKMTPHHPDYEKTREMGYTRLAPEYLHPYTPGDLPIPHTKRADLQPGPENQEWSQAEKDWRFWQKNQEEAEDWKTAPYEGQVMGRTWRGGRWAGRDWPRDEKRWRFGQKAEGVEDWESIPYMPPQDETVQTGEPMDCAWSELMKARNLRSMGRSKSRAWKQPQYKIQPGGSDISTATSRRSKLYSRHLQPHKHRGIDRAPLSVHRTHLGIATKQPLRLFPRDYGQQTGSMQRRKWQGNIPAGHPSGHAMGPEVTYNPRAPKAASSEGRKIRAPGTPRLRGQTMGIKNTLKSEDVAGIKEDLSLIEKKMSYMHFAQMRRLMRKVKEALADKERRLKARVSSGPGKQRESGHMEGQDKTTRPTGATDSLDIPESWGAPSTMFAARGSGRVG